MHRQVTEFPAVCEFSEHDQENDEAGYPGPEFVGVHDFVAEHGDKPGAGSDYNYTSIAWDIGVDSIDQLGADNHVHCRPANAGKDIEDGDWRHLVRLFIKKKGMENEIEKMALEKYVITY